jgi:hypothetical protein
MNASEQSQFYIDILLAQAGLMNEEKGNDIG